MFGGVCHLLHGNMVAGVWKEFLILRLGEDAADFARELPHVRPFDITGRPMKGWVMIEPAGVRTRRAAENGWTGPELRRDAPAEIAQPMTQRHFCRSSSRCT